MYYLGTSSETRGRNVFHCVATLETCNVPILRHGFEMEFISHFTGVFNNLKLRIVRDGTPLLRERFVCPGHKASNAYSI